MKKGVAVDAYKYDTFEVFFIACVRGPKSCDREPPYKSY